jgi:hypothetical protein
MNQAQRCANNPSLKPRRQACNASTLSSTKQLSSGSTFMTSAETPTRQTHSLRFQRFVCGALVLFLGQLLTGRVCGAEDAADPYDVLYDMIMTRYGKDGKSYAENETPPVIFKWSDFPFGDKTFKKFNAALDAFAALPQARIEAYSDINVHCCNVISGK